MRKWQIIELVIKIPEEDYQRINSKEKIIKLSCNITDAIKNGTPLPKGHGRLIDADKLWDSYHNLDYDFYEALDLADAIIEAESEEE